MFGEGLCSPQRKSNPFLGDTEMSVALGSFANIDSISAVFPNALTRAFSITSFREHKELIHRSFHVTMETLSALFPPELINNMSLADMEASARDIVGQYADVSFGGLLRNVSATVIQTIWRGFVARVLVKNIKRERAMVITTMHADNLFQVHILTSQTAVRRYLATRHAEALRNARPSIIDKQNIFQDTDTEAPVNNKTRAIQIGVIRPDELPPDSKFTADGDRIEEDFVVGDFARQMAAVVIQRQVKRQCAERWGRLRRQISMRRTSESNLPQSTRKLITAAESVMQVVQLFRKAPSLSSVDPSPVPPSVQLIHHTFSRSGLKSGLMGSVARPPSRGAGLGAVFWDASGLLLNPRAPDSSCSRLWGLHILHDVAMLRRLDDPSYLNLLPLTIWVQGTLDSEEHRSTRRARPPTGTPYIRSQPTGRTIPISPFISPRTKRRPTDSAKRLLTPLMQNRTRYDHISTRLSHTQ